MEIFKYTFGFYYYMPEAEKYKFTNISIKDLLKEELVKKIEESKLHIFPINLVLIYEEGEGNKKKVSPIILSHQNEKEIKEKTLHLDSPDMTSLKAFSKIIEELGGK